MADLGRALPNNAPPTLRRGQTVPQSRAWRRPTSGSWRNLTPAAARREARIDRACDAWYRGFVAEATEAFCRKDKIFDSSGRHHHGVLSADDMARWQAPVETPTGYDYRGYTVIKGGPWGQGPVLLQQLALLSGFDLDDTDPTGAEFVHTVTECAKLAYADREAWYGDPDFVDVPMATLLLSPAYNDARRKLVGDRASLDLRPGSPDGRKPYVPAPGKKVAAMAGIGEPTVGALAGIGEPTIDPIGAVAAVTPATSTSSIAGATWSRRPRAAGGCNRRRSSRRSASASARGCKSPGSTKRARRASNLASVRAAPLSPTLALKDGEPYMAFGTPGGDGQDQWSTQLFLHHVFITG